jgi:hypothetical protein
MIAAVAAGRLELTELHGSGQGSRHGLAPDTVAVRTGDQPAALPITVALLQAAEPSNTAAYYAALVDAMNACASAYQVDTPLRVAHFLAQIGHESRFKAVEENGNYSPTRMREIFGCGSPARYDKQADECKLGAAARSAPSCGPTQPPMPTAPPTCSAMYTRRAWRTATKRAATATVTAAAAWSS